MLSNKHKHCHTKILLAKLKYPKITPFVIQTPLFVILRVKPEVSQTIENLEIFRLLIKPQYDKNKYSSANALSPTNKAAIARIRASGFVAIYCFCHCERICQNPRGNLIFLLNAHFIVIARFLDSS